MSNYTGLENTGILPPPLPIQQQIAAQQAQQGVPFYLARPQAQTQAQGQSTPQSQPAPAPASNNGGGGGGSFGEGFANGADVGKYWGAPAVIPAGILGGLGNVLGLNSDNKPSTPTDNRPIDQRVADFAKAQGLDPQRYTTQFELAKQAAAVTGDVFDDKAQKEMASGLVKAIVSDAQAKQTQQAQTPDTEQAGQIAQQQRISDQNFTLALQAQSAKYFQPFVDNIIQGGVAQADALRGLASQVPASFRGVYDQQAKMALANSQSLAGAYMAQAMPTGSALYQQVQAETLANQQAQLDLQYKQAQINQSNALAQYYLAGGSGGGSSGGQTMDDILAAQGK